MKLYSVPCREGEIRVAEPPEGIGPLFEFLKQFPAVIPPPSMERALARAGVTISKEAVKGGAILFPEIHAREGSRLEDLLQLACTHQLLVISRELKGEGRGRLRMSSPASEETLSALEDALVETFSKMYGLVPNAGQRAAFKIVPYLLEGGGTLVVIMSTGSGKSAIFQSSSKLASRFLGSYTLVISPLRALMRDQVYRSSRLGLRAAFLDSSVPQEERERILREARRGELDLLYSSPERLQEERMRRTIAEGPPSMIVLDEVHTVVEWGYTFRPSYAYAAKLIASLRNNFKPPVIALTATISKRSLAEVLRLLGHREEPGEDYEDPSKPIVIRTRTVREDISFEVVPAPQGYERLEVLEKVVRRNVQLSRGKWDRWLGVIFTSYVSSSIARWANVDTIASFLKRRLDVEVMRYHGAMRDRERQRVEEKVREVQEGVLVSTKAFGMGIDVKSIRWVIHYIMSDSVEEYYQEVGRAGRDGEGAIATLLYSPLDADLKLALSSAPRLSFVMRLYNTLASLYGLLRDPGYLILPDDVLDAPRQTMRALEALRTAGILDYHMISRAKLGLSEEKGDYYMRIGDGLYVTVSGEGQLEISSCPSSPLYSSLKISGVPSVLVKTGRCLGKWKPLSSSRLLVVEPLRNMELTPSPPWELFLSQTRERALEEMRVERLRELVERAMISTGEQITREIEGYLERDQAFSTARLEELVRGTVRCSRCYEEVARLVEGAERALGRRGVSLYCDRRETWEEIYKSYVELFGRPMKVRARSLSSLSALVGAYGIEKLGDRGLIVVASRSTPSAVRLAEELEEYGYFSAFLW
ncbi:MAG: helicase-related protein [Acidilobaceae archaeon]|nr:helicase-related protein [Acidilobaceae archaeon]MCX8165106.1 helicase-related protein [Acidilobaceae archaeon]MDW7974378.1 helicase-related protein [Sulfolobales archaeon]